ncbi:MAG: CpsD/CapB family tyrosine-protein kinase [Desulfobulbaceae bacterium]|nr:CpsD/CapB family tyrosine-protein kinase [Desulfobulbaceae bacterium]
MGKVSKALNKVESKNEYEYSPASAAAEPDHASAAVDESVAIDGSQYSADKVPAENAREKIELRAAPFSSIPDELNGNWNERLVYASENFSGIAESFKKLRTMILYPESGKPPRSLMVLSSDAGEGKSFVCANLGISLANSVEHEALLIDCDLRRPTLQSLFGLGHQKGLANYLCSEEELGDLIVPTGLPKLSVLPAGPPPDNPSELISSEKMSAMIEELSSRDDGPLLLLDAPPFHSAAETLVLAQLVDKVVLVVRWGRPDRENIKRMLDQVGRKKIIGAVFNAFEANILDRKFQGVGYNNYYSGAY